MIVDMTTPTSPARNRLLFNMVRPQLYRDPWRQKDRVCRYYGHCISCDIRTYGFDDGEDDPRGPLGDHSSQPLDPEEFSCTGKTVPCCFTCQNDEAKYLSAVSAARRRGHWTEKAVHA